MKFRKILLIILAAILLTLFFSYKLLEVPQGLTIDEAAFGYNASLLSENLRDENNRFFPVFVLSLDKKDWRQPVAQYYQALYFKLFGRSIYNLKFTSVTIIVLSAILIYFVGGLLASLIFITTPIILIHSHLALDNIYPIPFILVWLIGILKYQKTKSLKYLILSGISLGISFYSYKGMRSAVPIWAVLTLLYLFYEKIKIKKPYLYFLGSLFPFFAVAPLLDKKYAGAVFGGQDLSIKNIYDFINFYISQFDFSFLYITSDTILHHSTGKHGMFLLASMPLFLIGIYQGLVKKNKFIIFLTAAFFLGPLLVSFVGSYHRASRLIFLVPIYSLIAGFGLKSIFSVFEKSSLIKLITIVLGFLFILNYFDFSKYYFTEYGPATKNIFYQTPEEKNYKKFYEQSKKENLTPYISENIANLEGIESTPGLFERSLYFPTLPKILSKKDSLPAKSILLNPDYSISKNP